MVEAVLDDCLYLDHCRDNYYFGNCFGFGKSLEVLLGLELQVLNFFVFLFLYVFCRIGPAILHQLDIQHYLFTDFYHRCILDATNLITDHK